MCVPSASVSDSADDRVKRHLQSWSYTVSKDEIAQSIIQWSTRAERTWVASEIGQEISKAMRPGLRGGHKMFSDAVERLPYQ